MSNMRQVTMALLHYTQDFDDQFLPLSSPNAQAGLATNDGDSMVIPAIFRYAPQAGVFHCPADYRDGALTYSINDFLGGSWPSYTPAAMMRQVSNGAETFAMIEEVDLHPRVPASPGGFVVDPDRCGSIFPQFFIAPALASVFWTATASSGSGTTHVRRQFLDMLRPLQGTPI